ncbi:MAG: thermonuclease family protein [Methyloceanibacter sp.]
MAAMAVSHAVIDGDTVHLEPERYRLLGIDAAEIRHAQCDAERRLGELTKHRLEALIRSGPIAFAPNPPSKRDRYGRLLVQPCQRRGCRLHSHPRRLYPALARAPRGLVHGSFARPA